MESIDSFEYWNERELKCVESTLSQFKEDDRLRIDPWFFTPKNLENVVGHQNLKFIRKIWNRGHYGEFLSYNVFAIIYFYLFKIWTEEDYKSRIKLHLNRFLDLFCDWWEKPIVMKWFESKQKLIQKFGESKIASIISSMILIVYEYKPSAYITPPKEITEEGKIIPYHKIIELLRNEIPGNKEVSNWEQNFQKKKRIFNIFLTLIPISMFCIFIFTDDIYFYLNYYFVALISLICIFIYDWILINKIHKNVWANIFILSLILIYINYFIYLFIYGDYSIIPHIIQLIAWIIIIISFSIFSFQYSKFGNRRYVFGTYFLYGLCIWDIIISLYSYFTNDISAYFLEFLFLVWIYVFFMIGINNDLNCKFSPIYWVRFKFIHPLETYKELGILEEFAQALADAMNQNLSLVMSKLDLSKSIEQNCNLLGLRFKRNINDVFKLISKHKNEIFTKIIPNCPEDRTCPVLDEKLEEFYKEIIKNLSIKNINLEILGIKVKEKLPNDIIISLERAEGYYKIFRILNLKSYGPSILELAKSFENLFKKLMRFFIQQKDSIAYVQISTNKQKELPIVEMIKKGVDLYTFGSFLFVIQETLSYPGDCKIKKQFYKFLQKYIDLNIEDIKLLRQVTNFRNDYAHISGEIVTKDHYFIFRKLIFDIINGLTADLSTISKEKHLKTKALV